MYGVDIRVSVLGILVNAVITRGMGEEDIVIGSAAIAIGNNFLGKSELWKGLMNGFSYRR